MYRQFLTPEDLDSLTLVLPLGGGVGGGDAFNIL